MYPYLYYYALYVKMKSENKTCIVCNITPIQMEMNADERYTPMTTDEKMEYVRYLDDRIRQCQDEQFQQSMREKTLAKQLKSLQSTRFDYQKLIDYDKYEKHRDTPLIPPSPWTWSHIRDQIRARNNPRHESDLTHDLNDFILKFQSECPHQNKRRERLRVKSTSKDVAIPSRYCIRADTEKLFTCALCEKECEHSTCNCFYCDPISG